MLSYCSFLFKQTTAQSIYFYILPFFNLATHHKKSFHINTSQTSSLFIDFCIEFHCAHVPVYLLPYLCSLENFAFYKVNNRQLYTIAFCTCAGHLYNISVLATLPCINTATFPQWCMKNPRTTSIKPMGKVWIVPCLMGKINYHYIISIYIFPSRNEYVHLFLYIKATW